MGSGGSDHAEAVEPDVGRLEVPEGQPEARGVGPRRRRWSGPDPMMVWNGSEPSPTAGAAPDTPRPPSGRNAAGARPGGLDGFGLPRRANRVGRDGVDDERSPRLRWLENSLRGVARGQRVPSHPLYLPVPVATGSYERRVFACTSPSSLRPSQPLGSLHHSAHSRSGGPSKTAIPSQSWPLRGSILCPRAQFTSLPAGPGERENARRAVSDTFPPAGLLWPRDRQRPSRQT